MKKALLNGILCAGALLLGAVSVNGQNSNPWPTTGNVGIGTSSPSSPLHLKGGQLLVDNGWISCFGNQYGIQFSGVVNNPSAANNDKFYFSPSGTGTSSTLSLYRWNGTATSGVVDFDASGNSNFRQSVNLTNGPLSVWGSQYGVQFSAQSNPIAANADKFYFSPSGTGANAILSLYRWNGTNSYSYLSFDAVGNTRIAPYGGNVVIGSMSMSTLPCAANLKLYVNGTIGATEVRVSTQSWCDYVFDNNYKLKPLKEVESFIKTNKHLPEVPSEKEVVENGVAVGEMMKVHMKKIEELTLYMIELQKQNEKLAAEVAGLKSTK